MPKIKILIVDDRADGLIALEAVLRNPRYTLYQASSGKEALSLILENDFAVIILDVQMPEMDGFEAARLIRQREQSREIPIIFVTAISTELNFIHKGYQTGAVDYLFKPFDPIVLNAKVSVFVELYEKNQRLKEQAERLQQSEERVRLLIDTARDIIATTNREGILTSLSPAFESITGYSRQERIGSPIEKDIVQEDLAHLLQQHHEAWMGRETPLFETRVKSIQGKVIILESCIRPIFKNGKIEEVLWVARDISERKRAEREEKKRYELERSNRELEEFAYICSHDLQEPLRVVVNYSQLIKRGYAGVIGEEGNEFLGLVIDNAKRMSKLVRDLLDYSRFGAAVALETTDLGSALRDALFSLKSAIEETGARVDYPNLPKVQGNLSQLTRLFLNLIGNSLKFHSGKTPEITISAEVQDLQITISVSDNGIGFDMKHAESIFLIFRRLHSRAEYEGTGVGLSICKKIVERHGGRIWVKSEKGKGTVFSFSLFLADLDTKEEEKIRTVPPPSGYDRGPELPRVLH